MLLKKIFDFKTMLSFVFFLQSEIGSSGEIPQKPSEENTISSETTLIDIPEAGLKIIPPPGWTASRDTPGLTLVMREPLDPKPSYDKPKYQRNITLMTLHQPSPIDFARMEELKGELVKQFGQAGSVSQFQIIESKIFDYRKKSDGILVYSSVNIGEYPMMQMHVLVSSHSKQYLMTYTDLAERFTKANDPVFATAWSSLMSLEVEGSPPTRFEQNKNLYLGSGGVFFIAIALGIWSFMRQRTSYKHYADLAVSGRDIDEDFSAQSSFATSLPSTLDLKQA